MLMQRFRESWFFWRHNLRTLLWVTLPFALAEALVLGLSGPLLSVDGEQVQFNQLSMVLSLLLLPLADAALISQLAALQAGRARPVVDCLTVALRKLLPLAGAYVLMVMPPILVLSIGLSLVPTSVGMPLGLMITFWWYCRVSIAPFIVVLEGTLPLTAVQQAWRRTAPVQGELVLALMLSQLVVKGASAGLMAMADGVFGQTLPAYLLASVPSALLAALVTIVLFRFYGLLPRESEPS